MREIEKAREVLSDRPVAVHLGVIVVAVAIVRGEQDKDLCANMLQEKRKDHHFPTAPALPTSASFSASPGAIVPPSSSRPLRIPIAKLSEGHRIKVSDAAFGDLHLLFPTITAKSLVECTTTYRLHGSPSSPSRSMNKAFPNEQAFSSYLFCTCEEFDHVRFPEDSTQTRPSLRATARFTRSVVKQAAATATHTGPTKAHSCFGYVI